MAMVKPAIFQIVGFQNSGKTTFVKKLITALQNEKIDVATIKHHGHGGRPSIDEEKDSHQHIVAGAAASVVEGDGFLLLQAERKKWSLEAKIQLLSFFNPHLILIEGHKYENYPKGIMIRNDEDLYLLEKIPNIKVVFYWDEKLLKKIEKAANAPKFHIFEQEGLLWLVSHLKKQIRENE